MTLRFSLSNIHSIYVFHFINSNSYQLTTFKKISYFTTLQYCTKPDRFKHKTKFSFSGSILWQVPNQIFLARNCVVLAQIENKMFRVRVSCFNNSSIIVSTFFPSQWTYQTRETKNLHNSGIQEWWLSWEHIQFFFFMLRFQDNKQSWNTKLNFGSDSNMIQ